MIPLFGGYNGRCPSIQVIVSKIACKLLKMEGRKWWSPPWSSVIKISRIKAW